jgi:hypothetical protein
MIALSIRTTTRLRNFAFAAMAVTTIGLTSLSAASPAAAMPISCTEGRELWYEYFRAGDYWHSRGYNALATIMYNKAAEIARNTGCA